MERLMDRTHHITHYDPDSCYGCKILTVQLSPPAFQAHYSYTVGRYVTNWKDFNDALKRCGEAAGADYAPIHPADLRATPPPSTAPTNLPRLVAHDEHGHPMHDPINDDPTIHPTRRSTEWDRQRARAQLESETADLIPDSDDAD
jgi:hypothetical protein